MKACKQCKLLKDKSEFFLRKKSKDRLDYICKICKQEKDRKWSKKNRSKKSASDRAWREDNKDHVRAYHATYRREERRNNPLAKLKNNLRRRIHKALNGIDKSLSTVQMLGTSVEEVMRHLESKFQVGMSWDNYGTWHVDHIIPLANAKTSDEMVNLFNYKNLQPLWALDNLKKAAKYEGIQ